MTTYPLTNPGFESGQTDWAIWHGDGTPAPEVAIEDAQKGAHPAAIHGGAKSLRLMGRHACWRGGVYRQLDVQPGDLVRLSAYIKAWASANPNAFPHGRDPNVLTDVVVGIDPTGGVDFDSTTVQKNWKGNGGDWSNPAVQIVAQSNRVTIFVGADLGGTRDGKAQWPIAALAAFFDDVEVDVEGAVEPPPPTGGDEWVIEIPAITLKVRRA